jgi:hypothetical protein
VTHGSIEETTGIFARGPREAVSARRWGHLLEEMAIDLEEKGV